VKTRASVTIYQLGVYNQLV